MLPRQSEAVRWFPVMLADTRILFSLAARGGYHAFTSLVSDSLDSHIPLGH